jgi:hypothetical protein
LTSRSGIDGDTVTIVAGFTLDRRLLPGFCEVRWIGAAWGIATAVAFCRRAEISSGGASRIYEDGVFVREEECEAGGTVVRLTPDLGFFVCSVADDAAAILALADPA